MRDDLSLRVLRSLALCALFAPLGTWASHPLITEDTGVLGRGVWQIELHGERSRDREDAATTRAVDASAVLAYGIAEQADLQLEVPYLRERTDGVVVEGRGDATVSLKWRFLELERLSLVFKPDLHEGGRWGTNFVAGYQLGSLELLGHLGYLRNRNVPGERRSLWHTSVAALYAATEKLKLALDLGRDTNPDAGSRTAVREVVLGLIYAPREDVDLGFGLKHGLSDPADDRSLLAGMKLRF